MTNMKEKIYKNSATMICTYLICCQYVISNRIFANIGDDIQLNCPHYSHEKPTQWLGPEDLSVYALGRKVNDLLKNAHKLAIIGESFNLQISNISIYETGQYRCIVLMKGLPRSADFIIEFFEPVRNMTIERAETGILVVDENKNSTLECHVVSGKPPEYMEWRNNSKTLSYGGPSHLSFTFIPTRYDEGKQFSCFANNSAAEMPSEQIITLFVRRKPMVTVAGGKDQLVIEEFRNVLLQCNYKSNINATNVQWHFFNGTLHSLKDKTANQKLIVRLHNIKRSESGMYCCAVTNDVGVGSDGVKVIVTYKPEVTELNPNKTFLTTINHPSNISFVVSSYENPTVLWVNILGGKLGIWRRVPILREAKYVISSTILPKTYQDFGMYSLRIRNGAGYKDVQIQLVNSEFDVSIFPKNFDCKTSNTIKLTCNIRSTSSNISWTSSWYHYRNKHLIRSFKGKHKDSESVLEIPHCDYRDAGEYKCIVLEKENKAEVSSLVSIKGPPVITNKHSSSKADSFHFIVLYYSNPASLEPKWHYLFNNTEVMINTSSMMFNQTVTKTKISMNYYGQMIRLDGWRVELIAVTNIVYAYYICQLYNLYGSSEVKFEYKERFLFTDVYENRTDVYKNKIGMQFGHEYVILISIGMLAFVVTVVCLFLRQKRLTGDVTFPSVHQTDGQTYTNENQLEHHENESNQSSGSYEVVENLAVPENQINGPYRAVGNNAAQFNPQNRLKYESVCASKIYDHAYNECQNFDDKQRSIIRQNSLKPDYLELVEYERTETELKRTFEEQ